MRICEPKGLVAVPILLARIVAIVSGLVMYAWFTHLVSIIQITPRLAPMQFNTALAMFLSSIGLLLLLKNRGRFSWIPASFVIVLGILTFLQYMLNADFGIDQLFVRCYLPAVPAHPGRMASNSALCFMLIGGATLMMARKDAKKK